MTTIPTADALLAAVYANPDEDTPRLMYADWLDENPPPDKVCPECRGTGWEPGREEKERCGECLGERLLGPDTSNADRAEFIRVQCGPPCSCRQEKGVMAQWITCKRCTRESTLLTAHPEWTRCECFWCEGKGCLLGTAGDRHNPTCDTCNGYGDLFQSWDRGSTHWEVEPGRVSRSPIFRRGFLDQLTVPTMADVAVSTTCDKCFGTTRNPDDDNNPCAWCQSTGHMDPTPTPWLRAVLAAVPSLTRVVVADREPFEQMWYDSSQGPFGDWVPPHHVPSPIWKVMDLPVGGPANSRSKIALTDAAALNSLACGVVTWGIAYKEMK